MWRVYQRGLERWIIDMLQPLLDSLVKDGLVPRFVQVWGEGEGECHLCVLLTSRRKGGFGAEMHALSSPPCYPLASSLRRRPLSVHL